MLSKLRLSTRLPFLFIAAAATMAVGIGAASYLTAAQVVERQTEDRLDAAADIGAAQIAQYLTTVESELKLIAETPLTLEALTSFSDTWNAWTMFGGNPEELLKEAYIDNNPHPAGERHLLDRADTDVHYNTVHAKYHPWFRSLLNDYGYSDIYLLDAGGNLLYSVRKEADFATNFSEDGGAWTDSDLGTAFRQALAAAEGTDIVAFRDIRPYGPSGGIPASFIARPVIGPEGSAVGVLALRMPIERTNEQLSRDFGLGASGELILVGKDNLMRNDSAATQGIDDVLTTQIQTDLLSEAWQAGKARGVATLHTGQSMRVAVRTLSFHGVDYAAVAAVGEREAMAPVVQLRNQMAIIAAALLLLVGVAGWFVARGITRPLSQLVGDMNSLAEGKTTIELDAVDSPDEIGDMSRAVAVFRDNAVERERLEAASNEAELAQQGRRQRIDSLISEFRSEVERRLETMSGNAASMSETSQALTDLASQTANETATAARTSDAASEGAQSVAAGAEELAASISEIGRQVGTTTNIVDNATTLARSTNEKVVALADSATRIGNVVAMIQEIAEQTNLLALNATIEAARAGDAGRGFAVVAAEVKQLAEQTSKATDEISRRIGDIQGSTDSTADAIGQIVATMDEVNSYAAAIAAAVEEQGAATSEISSSIGRAAENSHGVVETIAGVSQSMTNTNVSADQVMAAASEVTKQTDELRATVTRFLSEVAAA